MKTSRLRATGPCEGNSPVTGRSPAQMASNAENPSIWWHHHEARIRTALAHLTLAHNITMTINENIKHDKSMTMSHSCANRVSLDNPMWLIDAMWHIHWVDVGSGKGPSPGSTKPSPNPMLTDHEWEQVTFILGQFHNYLTAHYWKWL